MSLFTAACILLGMTRGDLRGHMGRLDYYCSFTYQDWLHTQEWASKNPDARTDSWLMDVPELYARRPPVGFLCPKLKKKLRKAGKTTDDCFYESVRPRQINDLLVHYDEDKITPDCRLEDILYLKRMNVCRK